MKQSAPRQQGRRGRVRLIGWAAIVLVWLLMAVAALECYQRIWGRRAIEAGRAHAQRFLEKGYQRDQAYLHARPAPQPPLLFRGRPPRASFLAASPAERQAFAEARRELYLVCDAEGRVVHQYLGPAWPEVRALGRRLEAGGRFAEILAPAQYSDFNHSLRVVLDGGGNLERTYAIPLAGGQANQFSFTYLGRLPGEDWVAVAVTNSPWLEGQRFRPNFYSENFNETQDFMTNSQGFRSPEIRLPKPDGVYRVVCLGGSTTVEGPRNDLTYPALLQEMLREHFQTPRIEVVNCGAYALNSEAKVARLEAYLELEPDLAIQYNFVNDVGFLLRAGPGGNRFRASTAANAILGVLWRCEFLRMHANPFFLPPDDALSRRMREFTLHHQQTVVNAVRKRGGRAAIASFAAPDWDALGEEERAALRWHMRHAFLDGTMTPPSYTHLVALFNQELKAHCSREGIAYLPAAEHLRGGPELFKDHCHVYVHGAEKKAAIIADGIIPIIEAHWKREPASSQAISGYAAP